MANNVHLYGFRWSIAGNGGRPMPSPVRLHVASGQDDVDDSSNSIHIRPGDPLQKVSTGGVIVANTTEAVSHICVGVLQYYEASTGLMRSGPYYPNQTTWGTVEARRGYVLGVPVEAGVWEIDVDDNTTATTEALYRALVGENVTHTCPGNTAAQSADPKIDISTHATTNTLVWRLFDISPSLYNRDFSGTNVKVLVQINVSQSAGAVASGGAVAGV